MANIDLPDGEKLTEYEARVLRLVFSGLTASEAADRLGLKRKSIYCHVQKVYQKLGTHSVLQARHRLKEMGVLDQVMGET